MQQLSGRARLPILTRSAALAQSVERLTRNEKVVGSIPTGGSEIQECGMRAILSFLGIAVGVSAIVYGGADDSPGLQGLGLLILAGSVVFLVRRARR